MEIDGVIAHALILIESRRKSLVRLLAEIDREEIAIRELKRLHEDDEMPSILKPFQHVRQLVSSRDHVKQFLKSAPEETFMFRGFSFEIIQDYFALRDTCALT